MKNVVFISGFLVSCSLFGLYIIREIPLQEQDCIESNELEVWDTKDAHFSQTYKIKKVGKYKYLLTENCGFDCIREIDKDKEAIKKDYHKVQCPNFLGEL